MSALDGLNSEQMLRNIHRILRDEWQGLPLWYLVSRITGHGEGVSTQICHELSWNPDADIADSLPIRKEHITSFDIWRCACMHMNDGRAHCYNCEMPRLLK